MMFYLQVASGIMGRILERDAKVKTMILDIYDSVLTMFKLKAFEKVLDSETSMYIATVENYKNSWRGKNTLLLLLVR